MNKKFLYAGFTIVAIAIFFVAYSESLDPNNEEPVTVTREYDFYNSNIKSVLESSYQISMSSPIKLTGSSLEKYCTFFDDDNLQNLVEYCTSTELLSDDGEFLGNVHTVGSVSNPKIILVVSQVDPFMNQLSNVKSIFDSVIQESVCDCWHELQPDGFKTVDQWIDKQREFHIDGMKPNSKSSIPNLQGKSLQMELSTNNEGYLWKLLIML